jgi:hypothetical protein
LRRAITRADGHRRPVGARVDPADFMDRLAVIAQHTTGLSDVAGRDDHRHADAAVEGTRHFFGGDLVAGEPNEDRRDGPAAGVESGSTVVRQDARQVLRQAAAGNVGECLDRRHGADRSETACDINARRCQQDIGQRPAVGKRRRGRQRGTTPLDELAHQRETVRVHAARCQAEHDVARRDAAVAARQQAVARHRADGEAGEVVIAGAVHARHFRRFAADQRAPRLAASRGDAGDHCCRDRRIERPCR